MLISYLRNENGQICLKLKVWKCYKLYRVHNIFCIWSYLYKLRYHKHLMLWKDLTCLPNDELLWSLPPWIQQNLSCPYNNVPLNFLLGARLCIYFMVRASLFHNWTKCSFWYFSNTNSNSLYESNSAWSSIFFIRCNTFHCQTLTEHTITCNIYAYRYIL